MSSVVADTHAVIWYLDAPAELSSPAVAALDAAANTSGNYIYVSAITLVEIRYLVEKGRVDAVVLTKIEQELNAPTPRLIVHPLDNKIATTLASFHETLSPICRTELLPQPPFFWVCH